MSTPIELIDLSVSLGPNPGERVPIQIERMPHDQGGRHLGELVGCDSCLFPSGLGWASERISAITHSGTHMDAPFHYSPKVGEREARTIDELPIEWFWGNGRCIAVDPEIDDEPISVDELRAWETRQACPIEAGEIVLFNTGAARAYGTDQYSNLGRGLSPDVVRYLVSRGVRVIGTDAWSIDPPYPVMRRRLARDGAQSVWAAHFVGRESEFCVLEKLCNLDRLPARGFYISCFPIKVHRGSAGWVRAVAFLSGAPA